MRRTGLLLASGITVSVLACRGKTLSLEGDGPSRGGSGVSVAGAQSGGGSGDGHGGGSSGASGNGGSAGSGGSTGTAGIYCDPGEYAVAEGTRSEFVCTKCLAGTFNDNPQAQWCTDCLMCGSLDVVAACTAEHDTECSHIGVGQTVGIDATYTEVVQDLAVDGAGNIWLVGHASNALTLESVGAFLRKMPADGSAPSFDLFGSDGYNVAITIAPSGTIWVAGTTTDDLGGPAQGAGDVYVRRYEPGREKPITEHFGTSSAEHVGDISADAAGNVWVIGDTPGDLLGTQSASSDLFARVYSPDGSSATGQLGGHGDQRAFGVAVDGAGNVWIAEQIADSNDDGSGSSQAAVMKLPADGGTAITDRLGNAAAESMGIAVDRLGNVWAVAHVDEGALIRKYPADGSSPYTEVIADAAPRGVAVDKEGNAWVVGAAICNVADDPLRDPSQDPSGCASPSLGLADAFVRIYPADGSKPHNYQFGTRSIDHLDAVAPGHDYGVWILGVRSRWEQSLWHARP